MTRSQQIGVLALALALIGTAIFWRHSHGTVNAVPTNLEVETQTPTDSEKRASSDNLAAEKSAPSEAAPSPIGSNDRLAEMGIRPDMTQAEKDEKYIQWYAAQSAKIAARHQHPIEFYGETVDESNQPVADVNARFILSESPTTPDGIVETNVQSDASGSFSFTDAVGKMLQVDVYKNGYYASKSNRVNFDYTDYQPNQIRPEIFHLRKKGLGADLITSKYGMTPYFTVAAPKNGALIKVDLLQRKAGDSGQLEIQTWIDIDPDNYQTTSWRLHLSIPGGGFVEENDEFPFEAPETGYQTQLDFPKPNASGNVHFGVSHKTYFIAFGEPRRYGYIDISASDHTGDVMLQYAINPDGSRYLEPRQTQ